MVEVMTRERLCLHVDLPRLARSECDELVQGMLSGASVSGELLENVYTRSLGNPLFAGELVREMTERRELVLDNDSWQPAAVLSDRVPVRVRALVAMLAAPLEESVRRVLALVAAANAEGISLGDLRRGGAALDPPVSDLTLLDALDQALTVGILEERNRAYAFRHPLIRSALYDDLPSHRRDQLHAALSGAPT
jgi:predicted ATPase